jgi:hypothetical protein
MTKARMYSHSGNMATKIFQMCGFEMQCLNSEVDKFSKNVGNTT